MWHVLESVIVPGTWLVFDRRPNAPVHSGVPTRRYACKAEAEIVCDQRNAIDYGRCEPDDDADVTP